MEDSDLPTKLIPPIINNSRIVSDKTLLSPNGVNKLFGGVPKREFLVDLNAPEAITYIFDGCTQEDFELLQWSMRFFGVEEIRKHVSSGAFGKARIKNLEHAKKERVLHPALRHPGYFLLSSQRGLEEAVGLSPKTSTPVQAILPDKRSPDVFSSPEVVPPLVQLRPSDKPSNADERAREDAIALERAMKFFGEESVMKLVFSGEFDKQRAIYWASVDRAPSHPSLFVRLIPSPVQDLRSEVPPERSMQFAVPSPERVPTLPENPSSSFLSDPSFSSFVSPSPNLLVESEQVMMVDLPMFGNDPPKRDSDAETVPFKSCESRQEEPSPHEHIPESECDESAASSLMEQSEMSSLYAFDNGTFGSTKPLLKPAPQQLGKPHSDSALVAKISEKPEGSNGCFWARVYDKCVKPDCVLGYSIAGLGAAILDTQSQITNRLRAAETINAANLSDYAKDPPDSGMVRQSCGFA
jgi:hypothetical protein